MLLTDYTGSTGYGEKFAQEIQFDPLKGPGEEINEAADTVNTLLVVGHEPTMSALAVGLAGAEGTDAAAVEHISEKFATSAIAVLTVAGDWKNLELNRAALIGFHVPR